MTDHLGRGRRRLALRRRQPAVRRVLAAGEEPRVGVRIGDQVLDLAAGRGGRDARRAPRLRGAVAQPAAWPQGRRVGRPCAAGSPGCSPTRPSATWSSRTSCRSTRSTLHLPFEVADYVDFYASLDHASNVGRIFRPDQRAAAAELAAPAGRLPRPRRHRRRLRHAGRPARAASARRPTSDAPDVRPEPAARHRGRARLRGRRRLRARRAGRRRRRSPTTSSASSALNDWSARDIQAWEYVPLGPFLGKSFATSVSALGHAARRRSTPPGSTCPARTRRRWPTSAPARPRGPRHRRRGGAQRRGRQPAAVPHDVLVARPDARPPDRQRRLAAHRRPVRLRHRSAAPSPTSAARSSSCRWGGTEPFAAGGRSAPSSRTATRSRCATPRPAPAAAGSRSARSPAGSSPPGRDSSAYDGSRGLRTRSLPTPPPARRGRGCEPVAAPRACRGRSCRRGRAAGRTCPAHPCRARR